MTELLLWPFVAGLVLTSIHAWFGLHVLFRQVRAVDILGLSPDWPVLASLDWRAALLSAAAMVAMLRFKTGMIPTLAACAVAGVVLTRLAP